MTRNYNKPRLISTTKFFKILFVIIIDVPFKLKIEKKQKAYSEDQLKISRNEKKMLDSKREKGRSEGWVVARGEGRRER